MLRNAISLKAARSELAPEFSTAVAYDEGRLVIYEGRLYMCTEAHVGEWDPGHFAVTTIDEALSMKRGSGDLFVKDEEGMFHKVVVERSGDVYTLAVEQEGVVEPS